MNAFDDDGNDNNDNNNYNNNKSHNNKNPPENQQRTKKGKGRQKITIAKIQNDTNLQVTFSKRRAGVFKKASELSTLCGAESAVVVFSPGNKPHSFGHPSVEAVSNRFLRASGNNAPPASNADQLIRAHGEAAMQRRNNELVGVEAELERERQRKNELIGQRPPEQQLDNLGYDQLEQLKLSVLGFQSELEAKVRNVPSLTYPPPFGNPSAANALMGAGGASSTALLASGSGSGSGNYGYMVQYPPLGPGGGSVGAGNYGDAGGVGSYDVGMGSSDVYGIQAMLDDDDDDDDDGDNGDEFEAFGGGYRPPPDQF